VSLKTKKKIEEDFMGMPGGKMSARPLHFFWILDCSGSMYGEKVGALNNAIREALPHIRKVADENPGVQVYVRALRFSNGADWIIKDPVKIDSFIWEDIKINIGEMTNLGAGLSLLNEALPSIPERSLPPVIVLVSDGQPTDDYKTSLVKLKQNPFGEKAARVSVAIGRETDLDVLQDFIGKESKIKPVQANNPQDLVEYIKVVSTRAVKIASQVVKVKDVEKIVPETVNKDDDDTW
jgi:uncharacterized protein YegL